MGRAHWADIYCTSQGIGIAHSIIVLNYVPVGNNSGVLSLLAEAQQPNLCYTYSGYGT